MYLNFRQGLISGSNFILEGPNKWGIQITGKDLQITLCNGPQDILINISNDLSGVFGTIDKTVDQYLFVEVDRRGNYIFGTMSNDYIIGEDEPTDVEEGQWWFNTRNKTLYKKIPNRGFMKTIGCILAEIKGGVVIEYATGVSQVGILGSSNEFRASELLRDVNGQSIFLSDGTYLTKTSNLLIDGVTPLGSIEASNLYGIADEDIPAFSVVRIMDNGNDLPKIELVEYDDVGDSLVGFVKEAAFYGEDVKVSLHGIFMNPDWDLLNGARVGSFVFAGPDNDRGLVVNKDPHSENNLIPRQPPIGRIINKSTILFTTSNNQIIEIEEEIPEPVRPATTGRAGIVKLSKSSANPNDPVVVEENDPRMFDAREPLPHTHAMDEVDFDFDDIDIDFEQGGGTGGASEPSNLEEWIEYLFINKVEFDDPRLNDPRPPLPHLHTARDVNVTGFEDAYGNMQEDTDAQEWVERLFNEKIGKDGGVVDGTLSIMREPEFGTDAVNKAFVDKVLGSAHRTIRITENFKNISSGATVETSVDLSNYGIELEGSGVRGILYYKNSSSSSNIPYEVVVSDPIRGRQYTSQGSGEDREPITVEFTEDIVISVRNEGGGVLSGVSVEVSILILEGIESVQIGIDDLDNIVLDGSNIAITSAILRTLRKTIEVGYGETNAESIVFNTLGNNSTRIVEVDLSLMEREFELNDSSNYVVHDSDTEVTSGGFLDVGELQELYDIMCPACVAHKGNRCASNAHEFACTIANNVLTSSSTTQGEVDNALLQLRNSAFVAITSGSGPITIGTQGGSQNYAIKYRELGTNGPFLELKPFNTSDYNTTNAFNNSMEIYIVEQHVANKPNLSDLVLSNSATLERIVTWGDLGVKKFLLNLNTRPFEVPDWLPSSVNNMTNMFQMSNNFNSVGVSTWDISNVTSLNGIFFGAENFNRNINGWNISNVTTLGGAFNSAIRFNQPLNNWDTTKVTTLATVFNNAQSFNQNIDNWNTVNVTSTASAFNNATRFNQPLNSWDVRSVTNMSRMFAGTPFNQPLSNWNPKNVTNMSYMFQNSLFNQPLKVASGSNNYMNPNRWDTRKVTNMNYMFSGSAFNQQTIDWRVENVLITKDYPGFRRGADNDELNAPNWARTRPRFGMGAPTNQYNTTNGTKDAFYSQDNKHDFYEYLGYNYGGDSSIWYYYRFTNFVQIPQLVVDISPGQQMNINYIRVANSSKNYIIFSMDNIYSGLFKMFDRGGWEIPNKEIITFSGETETRTGRAVDGEEITLYGVPKFYRNLYDIFDPSNKYVELEIIHPYESGMNFIYATAGFGIYSPGLVENDFENIGDESVIKAYTNYGVVTDTGVGDTAGLYDKYNSRWLELQQDNNKWPGGIGEKYYSSLSGENAISYLVKEAGYITPYSPHVEENYNTKLYIFNGGVTPDGNWSN